jgi:hypothetical protein
MGQRGLSTETLMTLTTQLVMELSPKGKIESVPENIALISKALREAAAESDADLETQVVQEYKENYS